MKRQRIGFDTLFDHLGSDAVRFSDRAQAFDGTEVELSGYLSPAHDGSTRMLLVDTPGACPDCSPVPVAAVHLPSFQAIANGAHAIRLVGRLAFGFEIEADGNASFLRLHNARIATGLPLA